MNKIKGLIFIIFSIVLLSGCGNNKSYNYNRINVKTIVDNACLTETFDEAYNTVYFYPQSEGKSYLYIIKETERDEYSLDTASTYLSTMRDILDNGYQLSKKETIKTKKKNNQFICTDEYSAKDKNDVIYDVKTKYIYDIDSKEALMVICFIDDKEDSNIKNAFKQVFTETILEQSK